MSFPRVTQGTQKKKKSEFSHLGELLAEITESSLVCHIDLICSSGLVLPWQLYQATVCKQKHCAVEGPL